MTSDEERLIKLSGRLSHDAWLMLCDVRNHPRFGEVLTDLERREGQLSSIDLEIALGRYAIS